MVFTPKVLTCSLNEFNSSVSKVKYKNKLNMFKMFNILNSFWDKRQRQDYCYWNYYIDICSRMKKN